MRARAGQSPACASIQPSSFTASTSRGSAVGEDLVVEGSEIELVSEPFLCPVTEFDDLEFADLVGQRLARHDDVAVEVLLHDDVQIFGGRCERHRRGEGAISRTRRIMRVSRARG